MNNQSTGGNSFLVPHGKNGLETTFNNGQYNNQPLLTEKRFNLSDFEMRTKEFQERKLKKIAAMKDEKFIKAVEECTFLPNTSVNQSQLN